MKHKIVHMECNIDQDNKKGQNCNKKTVQFFRTF